MPACSVELQSYNSNIGTNGPKEGEGGGWDGGGSLMWKLLMFALLHQLNFQWECFFQYMVFILSHWRGIWNISTALYQCKMDVRVSLALFCCMCWSDQGFFQKPPHITRRHPSAPHRTPRQDVKHLLIKSLVHHHQLHRLQQRLKVYQILGVNMASQEIHMSLPVLAVDTGGDVRDQVGEKIANSLAHFSAKETILVTILFKA